MKAVELLHVSKTYDKQQKVVEDINVKIEPGEFFVLVGPSGCGKSTILRMIAGLEEITDGKLCIDGAEVNQLPPSKRSISMVFQNYALYPHLSVYENIVFGLSVQKVDKKERERRCKEVSGMLGLSNYLDRKPKALSGGQRQRVALARAIVNEAPICLMDEPLSNLDAKLRSHMRSEIKRIQRQLNMTMIYVTHDQVEAMTMGDRIMVLNEGVIQQVGKPLEVYNTPANPFVAKFIGSPPMNLAEAKVDRTKRELSVGGMLRMPLTEEILGLISGDQVTLGIRPEFLRRAEPADSGCRFKVKVTHVEVLGNETVFTFDLGGTEWQAKWYGQWQIETGDIVEIAADTDQACLFELENERLIKGPALIGHELKQEVLA